MEKEKVVSSLAYNFIERISVKLVGLVISIILARLIAPDDLGQLAIITVFINLSQTIIQGGFNTALIQSKTTDETDYSTVFYISLSAAIVLIAALYIGAPFISHYYETDALTWPIRAYSFVLLFGAFNSVQLAKLQKEMKFKITMYATLIATVLSGILGIAMAYLGLGLWALVIYNASHVVFSCLTMLASARWIPRLVFSFERAKQLFSYGWKMFVSAILCSVYYDIRTLIVGKKFSTEDLGYYDRGQQFPIVISQNLSYAIQAVMFPTLAACQDEISRVKALLRRSVTLGAIVIVPMMVGLAVTAESVILLLLTDKWLPCLIYMQIVCIAEASLSLCSSNLVAIKAIGRSDVYMKLEIVRRVLMLVVLAISLFCFNSPVAIAVGFLISSWLDYIVITIPVKKLLNYGLLEQLKDLWKIFAAAAVMGVVVYAVSLVKMGLLLGLCVQIATGVAVYVVACWLLKIESFIYLKNMIMEKIGRR